MIQTWLPVDDKKRLQLNKINLIDFQKLPYAAHLKLPFQQDAEICRQAIPRN